MKKTMVWVGFFIGFQISVNAQSSETTSKIFIQKNNGDIIYAPTIEYKTPLFKKSYLAYGNDKIDASEVKFYQILDDYYINLKPVGKGFARRIIEGKINLYEQTTMNAAPMWGPSPAGFSVGMTSTTSHTSRYYNFGFEDAKVANYKNLMIDMKDNENSIASLARYQKNRNKRTLWYVIGGIAMVGGILTATKGTGETTQSYNFDTGRLETVESTEIRPVNLTIGILGFATIITTYVISRKKTDHIKEAILIYNQ